MSTTRKLAMGIFADLQIADLQTLHECGMLILLFNSSFYGGTGKCHNQKCARSNMRPVVPGE